MKKEYNIGDYYDDCRKEAQRFYEILEHLKKQVPRDEKEIRKIEKQLEFARYVGD